MTVTDMDQLDRMANDVFTGRVVRKDLVRRVKIGHNVPTSSSSCSGSTAPPTTPT